MNVRIILLESLVATFLVGCKSAELVHVDAESRKQRVQEANWNAQSAVSNAGCALGLPDGAGGSRVVMVERNRLPFEFPAASLSKHTGVMRMKVARILIPLSAPRAPALLACLVSASGQDASVLASSVRKTTVDDWDKLAYKAASEGMARPLDLDRAVAEVLLDSTLKSKFTKTSPPVLAFL